MSRISLCIITKNEALMLPDCLKSALPWVDEVVVADTGSDDDTVAIARALGAKVVHHTWRDDFAAARNAALAGATGDWVLVLDADERLAPGAGARLREAVKGADFDLGCLPLHNARSLDASPEAVLGGQARIGEPQLLPRLMRRTQDLRWNGAIHESVSEWIVAGKRRVGAAPVHIIHLGAVPSYRISRQKRERNVRLLQARCAAEPENPSPFAYLAYEFLGMGESAQAREAAEAAWGRIVAQRHEGPFNHALVQTANILAHLQNQAREMDAALETLETALRWNGPHPNLHFLRGVALELKAWDAPSAAVRQGWLKDAEAAYERCLALHGQIYSEEINPGATSWAAMTRLGFVYLEAGRGREAVAAFKLSLEQNPEQPDARYGEIEAQIAQGDAKVALRTAQGMIRAEAIAEGEVPPPEPYLLAAMACEALGRMDTATALLSRASERARATSMPPPRRAALRELLLAVGIHHGSAIPGSGLIGHLSALIGRRAVVPPEGDGRPVEAATLREQALARRILCRLIESGRGAELEALFEPRAEALLPGVLPMVTEILPSYGAEVEAETDLDPIFIGGAGRSGTTLFRAMMDAHPRLSCGPEAKLVPVIMGLRHQWLETMGDQLAAAGVERADVDRAVGAFIGALLEGMAAKHPGTRVAEKTPHNLLYMNTLAGLFPRARFIHVVRDGRAVASSLVKQGWVDAATGQPLWYCQSVENGARYWGSVVQTIRQQAAELPGRCMEVRYEALVTDPRGEMAKVLAFLGEPWDAAVLRHHEAEVALPGTESSSHQVEEAIHTRAVEGWRDRLSAEDLAAAEAAAGPILRALGYLEEDEEGLAQAG